MALFVSGERVDESLIRQEVEHLRPHYERAFEDKSHEEREAQLIEWSRENVIERVLLRQHAEKHCRQIPQERVDALFRELCQRLDQPEQLSEIFGTDNESKIKERIRLDIKVETLLEDVCKALPAPSNEDVTRHYEENKEQFASPERVRVAHIVKHMDGHTDEAAAYSVIKQARDELKNGVMFEMLAPKYSDCPENGGDLGYIQRGQMVEEFEDVVFNLAVNQVSEIFRTRYGFHIAKLYDRKAATTPPLEQVRDNVVSQLTEQMRSKAVDDFIDALKADAKIEEIR
jgi:parvulin-like peptidyl-prolyl isomerase